MVERTFGIDNKNEVRVVPWNKIQLIFNKFTITIHIEILE